MLAKDGLWKKYKRFITLNASIRGPFLPAYSSGACWSDVFLGRITEKIKVRELELPLSSSFFRRRGESDDKGESGLIELDEDSW